MAALLDEHRLRAATDPRAQHIHYRHAEHRILRADRHEGLPAPRILQPVARLAGDRGAGVVVTLGHHRRKATQPGLVARVGEWRDIGSGFRRDGLWAGPTVQLTERALR